MYKRLIMKLPAVVSAIIGLGNPGPKFVHTRHNIGFKVVEALAHKHGGAWHDKDTMELTEIMLNHTNVLLIKPQTFMNSSGRVLPYLLKKGIKPENILVVHDELEKKFGNVSIKFGGSARGHNGLRSIIEAIGTKDFPRLRFGIGRPEDREDVGDYVLRNFSESEKKELDHLIDRSVDMIEELYKP
jgi:peptidyl-tRNA hydrolase, PTH1 family